MRGLKSICISVLLLLAPALYSQQTLYDFGFKIFFNKEAVSYIRFLDSAIREEANTISSVVFSLVDPVDLSAHTDDYYVDYRINPGESVSMIFVNGKATVDNYTDAASMLVSGENHLNYNVTVNEEPKISFEGKDRNSSEIGIGSRTITLANNENDSGSLSPEFPLKVEMEVNAPSTDTGTPGFVSGQYTGYVILTITSDGN